jgi:hypothetical protein
MKKKSFIRLRPGPVFRLGFVSSSACTHATAETGNESHSFDPNQMCYVLLIDNDREDESNTHTHTHRERERVCVCEREQRERDKRKKSTR